MPETTVFYASYIFSELRRRSGRTILTALGLALGVGLVVTVTALSSGLDRAQDEVLKPLTGVGTDMTVTRPISFDTSGGRLPAALGGGAPAAAGGERPAALRAPQPRQARDEVLARRLRRGDPAQLPGVHRLEDRRPRRRRRARRAGSR